MWHITEKKMSTEKKSLPFTHLKSVKPVRLAIWDDEEIMNVKNILITSGCIYKNTKLQNWALR